MYYKYCYHYIVIPAILYTCNELFTLDIRSLDNNCIEL